jgi:hypothetical protein
MLPTIIIVVYRNRYIVKGLKKSSVLHLSFTAVACWQGGREATPPPQLAILGGRKNEKGAPIPRRILKVDAFEKI